MIVYIYQEKELDELVSLILNTFPSNKTFVLEGDLGAGKTTFVKYFCQQQLSEEAVSSPTFSLVNEYLTPSNQFIYHFDLYRINEIDELIDLGFEDYLDSGRYVFIEWPELALSFLDEYIHIGIEHISDSIRKFTISQQ